LALGWAEFLGIVESGRKASAFEDDGGGDDRAGERAAPGFVKTGDQAGAEPSRSPLETVGRLGRQVEECRRIGSC
jgi:hypothetical protein